MVGDAGPVVALRNVLAAAGAFLLGGLMMGYRSGSLANQIDAGLEGWAVALPGELVLPVAPMCGSALPPDASSPTHLRPVRRSAAAAWLTEPTRLARRPVTFAGEEDVRRWGRRAERSRRIGRTATVPRRC